MNITRRAWLGGSIAATGWALGAAGARAQQASADFPAKDIKAICNFAPGTRSDVMVRFFAERVGAGLNRNVQVDNRIAENGNAGTKLAAKAKPDGYTIMITPGSYTLATAPAILKKPGFDPIKDFVPVTTLFKLNYAVAGRRQVAGENRRRSCHRAQGQGRQGVFRIQLECAADRRGNVQQGRRRGRVGHPL